MSDTSQGVGWWVASDGRWYPPEQHPVQQMPPPPFPPPYWPGHSGPPPRWQPRQTNGLAIASMVLGILWIYWVDRSSPRFWVRGAQTDTAVR